MENVSQNFGNGDEEDKLFYQPLVSIVIPSRNQGQFIEDTIPSIQKQNCPVVVHAALRRCAN